MKQPSGHMVKTYDKIAKIFAMTNRDSQFWKQNFLVFKKLIKGRKVLDIGCGAGRDAELFVKAGFDYTGIDFSAGMLGQARRRVKQAKFLRMDFYNLTFKPKTFDGFWAAASLLHIPRYRIRKVLRNIRKILTDEGIGFISIKPKTTIDQGIVTEKKYGATIKRFFAFYTDKEFQKILKDSDFQVIKHHVLKGEVQDWLCYLVKKDTIM